jgi:hypothetical protein
MARGGSALTTKQMQLQVGILPTIAECLDGFQTLWVRMELYLGPFQLPNLII